MTVLQAKAALAWWKRREKVLAQKIDQARSRQQDTKLSGPERDNARRALAAWRSSWRQARAKRKTAQVALAKAHKDASAVTGISPAGIAFIRQHEGCVLHPYNDSQNHATIGVGHLIHMGPVTAADNAKYKGFDQADADELLERDLDSYENAVMAAATKRHANGAQVTQNEVDAQVSFAFNVGVGGYSSSTLARLYGSGSLPDTVAAQFDRWHQPPEITGRRNDEKTLFLKVSG